MAYAVREGWRKEGWEEVEREDERGRMGKGEEREGGDK